jgi:hypothetical protein
MGAQAPVRRAARVFNADIKANIDSRIAKRTRLNFALARLVIEPATQRIDNRMQLA